MYVGQQQASAGHDPVVTPFVFDPREQRSRLFEAEWQAITEEDRPAEFSDGRLDASKVDRLICIPMMIRLRRPGAFEVRVTVDVNLDGIVQRLTTSSVVECQRCLELSSSLITLPGSGRTREARCLCVTNISNIALQLTGVTYCGVEGKQVLQPNLSGIVLFTLLSPMATLNIARTMLQSQRVPWG